MDFVTEYVAAVQELDALQEGLYVGSNLRRNNRLADKLRKIAIEIDNESSEMKSVFYGLLFHEEPTPRGWVAHHVLEVMHYDEVCRKAALKEIACIAAGSIGNRIWLEQWLIEHPEDKELLGDSGVVT